LVIDAENGDEKGGKDHYTITSLKRRLFKEWE
jgi:hypothetical protein